MEHSHVVALLVGAIGSLFAFIVWLVKVIIKMFNKNTEAITHLSSSIDNMPDAIMNKILLTTKKERR